MPPASVKTNSIDAIGAHNQDCLPEFVMARRRRFAKLKPGALATGVKAYAGRRRNRLLNKGTRSRACRATTVFLHAVLRIRMLGQERRNPRYWRSHHVRRI